MSELARVEGLLEQLLRVAAATAVQGRTLSEGAPYLERLGVSREVIAKIYGTSDASVRAILSQSKKEPMRNKRGAR